MFIRMARLCWRMHQITHFETQKLKKKILSRDIASQESLGPQCHLLSQPGTHRSLNNAPQPLECFITTELKQQHLYLNPQ